MNEAFWVVVVALLIALFAWAASYQLSRRDSGSFAKALVGSAVRDAMSTLQKISASQTCFLKTRQRLDEFVKKVPMPLARLIADRDFLKILNSDCLGDPGSFAALLDDENRYLIHPDPAVIGQPLDEGRSEGSPEQYKESGDSEAGRFYSWFDTKDSYYYLAPLANTTTDGKHLWYLHRFAAPPKANLD